MSAHHQRDRSDVTNLPRRHEVNRPRTPENPTEKAKADLVEFTKQVNVECTNKTAEAKNRRTEREPLRPRSRKSSYRHPRAYGCEQQDKERDANQQSPRSPNHSDHAAGHRAAGT